MRGLREEGGFLGWRAAATGFPDPARGLRVSLRAPPVPPFCAAAASRPDSAHLSGAKVSPGGCCFSDFGEETRKRFGGRGGCRRRRERGGSLLGTVRAPSPAECVRPAPSPQSGGGSSPAGSSQPRCGGEEPAPRAGGVGTLRRGHHAFGRERLCPVAGVTPAGPGAGRGRPDCRGCSSAARQLAGERGRKRGRPSCRKLRFRNVEPSQMEAQPSLGWGAGAPGPLHVGRPLSCRYARRSGLLRLVRSVFLFWLFLMPCSGRRGGREGFFRRYRRK